MKLRKIPYYLTHPKEAWHNMRLKYDMRSAIEQQWQKKMSYPLNIRQPRGFMEKLNWLKLYDHNPKYTMMADKYLAKKWVAEKIGEKYLIPTLAVYNTVEEIELNNLPFKFVLKCNHDSGSTILCTDKSSFDLEKAKSILNTLIHRNYYFSEYEWVYKNIDKKIIAEEYVDVPKDAVIKDSLITYKFMCFNGEPKIMYITVKNDDIWEDYYDMDYQPLDIKRKYRHSNLAFPKPQTWDEMKMVAKELSKDIPFVRVDLYEIAGQVKFSECTFYDWGGYCAFDDEWERRLGDWVKLPR